MRRKAIMVLAVLSSLVLLAAGGNDQDEGVRAVPQSSTTSTAAPSDPTPDVAHYSLDDMPVLSGPFGEAVVTGFAGGGMLIDRMHVPGGTDLTDLLPDGWCDVPHWGVVLEGAAHVRYRDGTEDTFVANDAYHMRAGHTVRFDEPTTMVEISPEGEMREVLAQITDAVMGILATTSTSP
jgi:hypothetical protein